MIISKIVKSVKCGKITFYLRLITLFYVNKVQMTSSIFLKSVKRAG